MTLCRFAISQCLYPHTCRHSSDQNVYHVYDGTDNQTWLHLHPSSSLAEVQPKWVVYQELVFTTKPFMRHACAIEYKWVQKLLPKLRQADVQGLAGREIVMAGSEEAEQLRKDAGIESKGGDRFTVLTASRVRSAGGFIPAPPPKATDAAKKAAKKQSIAAARERYLARKRNKQHGATTVTVAGAGAMDSRDSVAGS